MSGISKKLEEKFLSIGIDLFLPTKYLYTTEDPHIIKQIDMFFDSVLSKLARAELGREFAIGMHGNTLNILNLYYPSYRTKITVKDFKKVNLYFIARPGSKPHKLISVECTKEGIHYKVNLIVPERATKEEVEETFCEADKILASLDLSDLRYQLRREINSNVTL